MIFSTPLVVFLLAASVSAAPHFEAKRYDLFLNDCHAPQTISARIRLEDALPSMRVRWQYPHRQAVRAFPLSIQKYDAHSNELIVQATMPDSCLLQTTNGHVQMNVLAINSTRMEVARTLVVVHTQCQADGSAHWNVSIVHVDIKTCRIGEELGLVGAVGGTGVYLYTTRRSDAIAVACRQSSAAMSLSSFVYQHNGADFAFKVLVKGSSRHAPPAVPLTGIARIRCNVTTPAPQFVKVKTEVSLDHCLPDDTLAIAKVSVVGGELPIKFELQGDSSSFIINRKGEIFLHRYLDPSSWLSHNKIASLRVKATDAVGRVASPSASVVVKEKCDDGPTPHFNQSSYAFAFLHCGASSVVGVVKAAGNSTYKYDGIYGRVQCEVLSLGNEGQIRFDTDQCEEHPPCCPEGYVFHGQVAVVDVQTGVPSNELTSVSVTNDCSFG